MKNYLRFKPTRRGEYVVFAGRKRVGEIKLNGKYIRADSDYMPLIRAFVTGLNAKGALAA